MAPFRALPAELVEGILKELCLFCGPRHHVECSLDAFCRCLEDFHGGRIATLASLCLTSRRINSMATRHLYHHPHCDDWWLLAATLLSRPDLAQLVMELTVDHPLGVDYDDCAAELVAYFKHQFQTFTDAMSDAGKEFDEGLLEDGDSFSGGHNVPLDVLVTLCPNLQRLCASVDYFDVFRFCRPQSLLRLRSIALSHADTELGFGFDAIARLFLAAPNIADMSFWSVTGCRPSVVAPGCLAQVTSLDFQCSALGDDALVNIFSACPNLENLKYEMADSMVGDDQFSLREVREAVLAHAPKLKYLRLHTGESDDPWGYWDGGDADGLKRTLAERGIHLDFERRTW